MARPNPAVLLVLALCSSSSFASTCAAEDYELKLSAASQCLLMRRYGTTEPEAMVVWLHGDISSGGPANHHFSLAEQTVAQMAPAKVLSVALVRPGYPDGSGESSSVSLMHGGRADHYTRENLVEVGVAIEKLRAKFQPKAVVVVGHSGGAATAAVLLGMKPRLIDAAVLVACPCDVVAWRTGRRDWSRSESPIKWAGQVEPSTRIVAMTGSKDDNTSPELARAYVEALKMRGLRASFQLLPDETHTGAIRSPEVFNAVRALLAPK